MKGRSLAIAGLAVCFATLWEAVSAETVFAEISLTPFESGVIIEGSVIAFSDAQAEAELTVEMDGPAGRSKTVQKQRVEVQAGDQKVVARSRISIQDGSTLAARLALTQNDKLIAEATASNRTD